MAKGFNSLGLTVDYVKDLPFSGTAVNVAWANANKAHAGETAAGAKQERSPGSRTSKIARRRCSILKPPASLTQDDVEKAYDFFHDGHFFEPTGKVSRAKLSALAKAMESLGDLPGALDVDKLVLPGVTQMTD